MKHNYFKLFLFSILTLLFVACGGSSSPNTPNHPNNPNTPDGECAVVVAEDITIPSLLANSSAECDYLFSGDLDVKSSLTIEPGTVVQFDQDARLSIDEAGSISAVGTAEERIVLEGRLEVQGFWQGLCFGDSRESRLEYVDLLWAGKVRTGGSSVCSAAIGGVNGNGESVTIKNSLIAGSFTHGLDAQRVPLGEFTNNVFANNAEYGVRVDPDQVHKLDAESDYLGTSVNAPNGKPYVYLSGFLEGAGDTLTWRKLNAPYLAEEDFPYGTGKVNINDAVTITIEAGARFEFGPQSAINLFDGATLQTLGTAEAPVVFTGKEQTPGAWDGLFFQDSNGVLEHVQVSYGGAEGGSILASGNIILSGVNGSDLTIRNSTISHSVTCGVTLDPERSSLEAVNVTFADNAENICQ
jgi:hypothetical protein